MVHEKYVLKIDGHCLSFLFQDGPKRIHMLACDLPAYAQDDELFSSNSSVDSTSHEFPLSLIPDPRLLASFLVSSHSSVDPREQTLCHSQPTENTRKMEMEAFAIW
jgi:hypothetical protein